jgi:GNAT superfamily N-acetyltransferase
MPIVANAKVPLVSEYRSSFRTEVIDLILQIQNVEYNVNISLDEQPDLLDIENSYVTPGGGFWIALDQTGHVVGTIGLQLKTQTIAVLKKLFVSPAWRGGETGCASKLFEALLAFALDRGIETIVLDTPSVATRSHSFYMRNGFRQISEAELPIRYEYPNRDSLLFRLDLGRAP